MYCNLLQGKAGLVIYLLDVVFFSYRVKTIAQSITIQIHITNLLRFRGTVLSITFVMLQKINDICTTEFHEVQYQKLPAMEATVYIPVVVR